MQYVVLGGQMADFVIAEATLGALEPDTCHPTLLTGSVATAPESGKFSISLFGRRLRCRPLNRRKMPWIIVDED